LTKKWAGLYFGLLKKCLLVALVAAMAATLFLKKAQAPAGVVFVHVLIEM
jgi:hypothetical protein